MARAAGARKEFDKDAWRAPHPCRLPGVPRYCHGLARASPSAPRGGSAAEAWHRSSSCRRSRPRRCLQVGPNSTHETQRIHRPAGRGRRMDRGRDRDRLSRPRPVRREHRRHGERPSPSCLPATLEHSATPAGTGVDVSPEPETDTANPDTQISFLGPNVADIQEVSVVGSKSGYHHGHVSGYFQGDGGSFVPDKPFDAGERVTVRAVIGAGAAGRRVAFGFRVDTPYPTAGIAVVPATRRRRPPTTRASTRCPALQAPVLSVTRARPRPRGGRHPHDQRPRPGPVRAADLHAAGAARLVRPAVGGRDRGEPERADLRRTARPHVVEGPGALARLRPGRRRRHERQLPDGRAGRAAATACGPTCTTSRSPRATSPTSRRSTRSAAT